MTLERRVMQCVALGLMVALLDRSPSKGQEKKADDEKIIPELDRVTLKLDRREIRPLRVIEPAVAIEEKGGLRVFVSKGVVRALGAKDNKEKWTAMAPKDIHLAWLNSDDSVIYLAGFTAEEEPKSEMPLRVRRLERASGKWLDDLVIEGKAGKKQSLEIQAAVPTRDGLAVLSTTSDRADAGFVREQLNSYRVSFFKAGATKALWSQEFKSAAKTPSPGVALLWAARAPYKVQPSVAPLTVLGKDILVCAGALQDLIRLEGASGNTLWRLERIWEYQRGFIGPSVWQHFIGRNGEDPFLAKMEKKAQKQDKNEPKKKEKEPEPSRHNSVVGGPIVVPALKGGSPHMFVAVAKGPAQYAAYLSECVIYELNSSDIPFFNPVAMTTVPRMVLGGKYKVQKDGLVWACEGGAFMKLATSREEHHFGGPGGSDCLCRVAWYRHLLHEQPRAWLTSVPAGDPICFNDSHAFRVCVGGYVKDRAEKFYRFPIAVIDLKNGIDRQMLLSVPFKGKLGEPKSNYSQSTIDGKEAWHSSVPHILAVTWLHADNHRLLITLGMEEWSRTLEFDLEALERTLRTSE